MEPKTIESYGGPKTDALPVSNPETQVASSEYNRLIEDSAQMTRTAHRAIVRFNTTAVAAPVTYATAAVSHRSVWGSGDAQKPAVQKTATGLYTITYATSFVDGMGDSENVSFFGGDVTVNGSNSADRIDGRVLTIAANVVTIAVYAAGALADVGNASGAVFGVELRMI